MKAEMKESLEIWVISIVFMAPVLAAMFKLFAKEYMAATAWGILAIAFMEIARFIQALIDRSSISKKTGASDRLAQ